MYLYISMVYDPTHITEGKTILGDHGMMCWLVVGSYPSEKNIHWSIGMMTFPIYQSLEIHNPVMFQEHHQAVWIVKSTKIGSSRDQIV